MQIINSDGELVEVPGPFIRTAYNYDMDAASLESGLDCSKPSAAGAAKGVYVEGKVLYKPEPCDEHGALLSRTQQHFKEECDINTIVNTFMKTGQIPGDFRMPTHGDFLDAVDDFQTAQDLVIAAREEFLRLPAQLRERFGNSPQALMGFLENRENEAEARRLGLLAEPEPAPEPISVRVMPENSSST